jgi:hypothetical protein
MQIATLVPMKAFQGYSPTGLRGRPFDPSHEGRPGQISRVSGTENWAEIRTNRIAAGRFSASTEKTLIDAVAGAAG